MLTPPDKFFQLLVENGRQGQYEDCINRKWRICILSSWNPLSLSWEQQEKQFTRAICRHFQKVCSDVPYQTFDMKDSWTCQSSVKLLWCSGVEKENPHEKSCDADSSSLIDCTGCFVFAINRAIAEAGGDGRMGGEMQGEKDEGGGGGDSFKVNQTDAFLPV